MWLACETGSFYSQYSLDVSKARSTEEESTHGIRYRNKVESDVGIGALDLYYIVAKAWSK